jgi:flagella basal body P-ring formation protein FlgA
MTPLLLFAISAGCLKVAAPADQVTAGDLAAALPLFGRAPAEAAVGYAPSPGAQRIFGAAELDRIAVRLGLAGEPARSLCVERAVEPLDPGRLLEAMRRSLPDARIEIASFSRYPAPGGEIEFPPGSLQSSGLWNGWVRYGVAHRFAIWARVKARVSRTAVVAAEPLRAGEPVRASQLRVENVESPPGAATAGTAQSLEDVVGRIPRRTFPAGAEVRKALLAEAPEIRRGETVKVEVRQGAARLELEAKAEADGRLGERISVLNPETRRRFLARVEGKGRASAGEGINRAPDGEASRTMPDGGLKGDTK